MRQNAASQWPSSLPVAWWAAWSCIGTTHGRRRSTWRLLCGLREPLFGRRFTRRSKRRMRSGRRLWGRRPAPPLRPPARRRRTPCLLDGHRVRRGTGRIRRRSAKRRAPRRPHDLRPHRRATNWGACERSSMRLRVIVRRTRSPRSRPIEVSSLRPSLTKSSCFSRRRREPLAVSPLRAAFSIASRLFIHTVFSFRGSTIFAPRHIAVWRPAQPLRRTAISSDEPGLETWARAQRAPSGAPNSSSHKKGLPLCT